MLPLFIDPFLLVSTNSVYNWVAGGAMQGPRGVGANTDLGPGAGTIPVRVPKSVTYATPRVMGFGAQAIYASNPYGTHRAQGRHARRRGLVHQWPHLPGREHDPGLQQPGRGQRGHAGAIGAHRHSGRRRHLRQRQVRALDLVCAHLAAAGAKRRSAHRDAGRDPAAGPLLVARVAGAPRYRRRAQCFAGSRSNRRRWA